MLACLEIQRLAALRSQSFFWRWPDSPASAAAGSEWGPMNPGMKGMTPIVAVGDDGGADHGVEVLRGPGLADVAGRALVAMDGVGVVELDAIERDEEALEGGEGTVLGEGVEAGGKECVEGLGGAAVEQVADAVVGRDALDAEQGLAVGASLRVLQAALEGEEGGVLQEEGSEGTGGGVGDRELLVAAAPGIGECGGGLAEAAQQGIEGLGTESLGHIPSFKGAVAKSRARKPCSRPGSLWQNSTIARSSSIEAVRYPSRGPATRQIGHCGASGRPSVGLTRGGFEPICPLGTSATGS